MVVAGMPFGMRSNRRFALYRTADCPMVPTQSAPSDSVDMAAVAATPKYKQSSQGNLNHVHPLREESKRAPSRK